MSIVGSEATVALKFFAVFSSHSTYTLLVHHHIVQERRVRKYSDQWKKEPSRILLG